MLPAFDTPSGLPLSMINLATRQGVPDKEYPKLVSTAEVSTLQLEFRYLSVLTEDDIYWEKAEHVWIIFGLFVVVLLIDFVVCRLWKSSRPRKCLMA
jgi:hypothetical protein